MRYDGGQTSYLEVLDSERSFFDAQLAASEVRASHFMLSYVDLYQGTRRWMAHSAKSSKQQKQ